MKSNLLLQTCPLVRAAVNPSSPSGSTWIVSRLPELVGIRVDSLTVAILSRATIPCDRDTLVSFFADYDRSRVGVRVDGVAELGYLETNCPHRALADEMRRWRDSGWGAAAEYHFHTFGYPFERYDDSGASNEDARRMYSFADESSDTDRGKTYPDSRRVRLPRPALDQLPASARALLSHGGERHLLDADRLSRLLSWTAGKTGESRLPWPGAAPVMRRTSPSGGSRHPTEVYLLNASVGGLPLGWAHVDSRMYELEVLDERVPDRQKFVEYFSGLVAHADFEIEAALVFTCVFARNRYRYREPRTFRTVHLDVGHLLTTAEVVASALGVAATSLNAVNSAAIAASLELDPLTEAPMAALLVGTHRGSR